MASTSCFKLKNNHPSSALYLSLSCTQTYIPFKVVLILLSGCGKKGVVDPHEVLCGAIGLLPLEVGVPELGGSVVHTTRLHCTMVHANEMCVWCGWFEGAGHSNHTPTHVLSCKRTKRGHILVQRFPVRSYPKGKLCSQNWALSVSHKRIRPREVGGRSGVTFWPSLPGTTCHTHQPLCNRKWHRFINTRHF